MRAWEFESEGDWLREIPEQEAKLFICLSRAINEFHLIYKLVYMFSLILVVLKIYEIQSLFQTQERNRNYY